MTSPNPSKDKFFEKVINPYLRELMNHPQAIKMHEGVIYIWNAQGPKKEGSDMAMLAVVEHEIFKCQGMVERGLSANHSMITDFIRENKIDTKNVGEIVSKFKIKSITSKIKSTNSEAQTMSMNLGFTG
ncbi:40S ribosomal protein S5-1 [Hordeum vulgare]|nr:40S ribosomal protein S5-1 [Hordeum vulgare]